MKKTDAGMPPSFTNSSTSSLGHEGDDMIFGGRTPSSVGPFRSCRTGGCTSFFYKVRQSQSARQVFVEMSDSSEAMYGVVSTQRVAYYKEGALQADANQCLMQFPALGEVLI
jgi:hypothetical protein